MKAGKITGRFNLMKERLRPTKQNARTAISQLGLMDNDAHARRNRRTLERLLRVPSSFPQTRKLRNGQYVRLACRV